MSAGQGVGEGAELLFSPRQPRREEIVPCREERVKGILDFGFVILDFGRRGGGSGRPQKRPMGRGKPWMGTKKRPFFLPLPHKPQTYRPQAMSRVLAIPNL